MPMFDRTLNCDDHIWMYAAHIKGVPVELFVTGTGAGISGANTGGAGTGTGIFPCQ